MKEYYAPPSPLNKPEKIIRLRYVGESFGVDSLTNRKIYEVWVEDPDYYRVIDDSGEDYLYSPPIYAPVMEAVRGTLGDCRK